MELLTGKSNKNKRVVISAYLIISLVAVINVSNAAKPVQNSVNPSIKQLKPSLKAPIPLPEGTRRCPVIAMDSFRITGKVPVKAKKGIKRYRLRLQGAVVNRGNVTRGYTGWVVIHEHTAGNPLKRISKLRIKNLKPGKKIIIGALTKPLFTKQKRLEQPAYYLSIEGNYKSSYCKKNASNISTYTDNQQRMIQRQSVADALNN